jgi:hypothetical protein
MKVLKGKGCKKSSGFTNKGKGKGKVVPVLSFFLTEHHTMKVYWASEI